MCLIRRMEVVPMSWLEIMMERRASDAEAPAWGLLAWESSREKEEKEEKEGWLYVTDHMRVTEGDAERGGWVDARVHACYLVP